MLTSLAFVFLGGLLAAALCRALKLPGLVGMLLTGVLLGPCVLNLLDTSILTLSAQLRQMALIVILIRAGLSLDLSDLKRVGRPALLLSFVPACLEILGYVLPRPCIAQQHQADHPAGHCVPAGIYRELGRRDCPHLRPACCHQHGQRF